MFSVEYKGGNSVVISSKEATIVSDPKLSLVGLKDLKLKNTVQLATEERFKVNDDSFQQIFDWPGEYEVGDVAIRGIAARRHIDNDNTSLDTTIYRLSVGTIQVAVFGNIANKLSEDQYEQIGVVDIAIIPVGGGGYTLDATSAAMLVRQLEPKIVIPVHYADLTVDYEVPQDDLETFVKELGAPIENVGTKYKLKTPAGLPQVLTIVKVDRS